MIHNVIKENAYFDSVTLMLFSSKLNLIEGVEEAAVMMGTDHNLDLMINSNVLDQKVADQASSNDLVIGIRASSQAAIDEALKVLDEQFEAKDTSGSDTEINAKTVAGAVKAMPDLNFAIVSTPGRFAKKEVMNCLRNGINVLLFSDNVAVEEENELKDYALENELLMMGPDCGTAIINGVALGFANVVRRGNIGLVAASGTGLQEVTVLIDRLGGGISQAIGTGGRDLKASVGGKMALFALDALENDPNTEVIGIISKPPSASVMEKIINKVENFKKPVVACFLGGNEKMFENSKIYDAYTLENAAHYLVDLSKDVAPKNAPALKASDVTPFSKDNTGKYVRGLYTGGTLAYETMLILNQTLKDVYSNIALDEKYMLDNPDESVKHTIVDMGEDYFTDGMAHPMIDPRNRSERIKKEANDPETALILLDCVLGYGSNEDPAGELATAVIEARANLADREVVFIASITGSSQDPQNYNLQKKKLEAADIIVLDNNAKVAEYATLLMNQKGAH